MSSDGTSGGIQLALNQQAERIEKLRDASIAVLPKHLGQPLLDSSVESFYELSRVSASRSYLRFFAENPEPEETDLLAIGELVHDLAVTSEVRSQGSIVVFSGEGSLLLLTDQPESSDLDLIASSATTFRAVFGAFVEFRSKVCKLQFEEFGVDTLSDEEKAVHLELIREFWTFVAQTDPQILDSGSRFWSKLTSDAFGWGG